MKHYMGFGIAALPNKRPACALQLTYQEQDKGDAGFFLAEAKLTSVGGAVMYATGSGKASVCPGAADLTPARAGPHSAVYSFISLQPWAVLL